jgi:hypothetical protein
VPSFASAFVRPLLLALVGIVAVGILLAWPARSLDNPAYDALSHALTRRIAADSVALGAASVAVQHDSVRVTHNIDYYTAIRDTITLTDTVRVKEALAAADSVVGACTELQVSCSVLRVRAESSVAGLTLDRDRWKLEAEHLTPGKWDRLWGRIRMPLAFGLGAYLGARAVR